MDSDVVAPWVGLSMFVLLVVSLGVSPSSAHPPNETAHGVPEETFHKLWSGDHDSGTSNNTSTGSGSAVEELVNGTDIPLNTPPRAVERWNRGDHQDFPGTSRSVSYYPPTADRVSERFIRDAYAAIFTVQPATRARLSPSQQPLYVAPHGTLLATVDYRVVVPPNETSRDRRVNWTLTRYQINTTRLIVDDETAATTNGTHTPALSYNLEDYRGQNHQLKLAANISVQLRKEVTVCTGRNETTGNCTKWQTSVEYPTENVTVDDSVSVTEYDLRVSGYIARYPNGDLGLVVYKNQPWSGYALPNGDVHGVWRFYSARDPEWDRLVVSTESGTELIHSPLHPLRAHAYPIETGPTPSPRRNVSIIDVYGTETEPPTLPGTVHLDVLTQPYTASYGIATRSTTNNTPDPVRAWGLVRGVNATRPADEFARVQIHRSNLTLTVVNQTQETVTVQAQLRDASTGTPINTVDREGYLIVDGEHLNTSGDGTVTVTLDHPPAGVSARYQPGNWWENIPGYVGDSDTVLVQGTVLQIVSIVFRVGVPVSVFLVAVFIIDRFTAWRIWPPWQHL